MKYQILPITAFCLLMSTAAFSSDKYDHESGESLSSYYKRKLLQPALKEFKEAKDSFNEFTMEVIDPKVLECKEMIGDALLELKEDSKLRKKVYKQIDQFAERQDIDPIVLKPWKWSVEDRLKAFAKVSPQSRRFLASILGISLYIEAYKRNNDEFMLKHILSLLPEKEEHYLVKEFLDFTIEQLCNPTSFYHYDNNSTDHYVFNRLMRATKSRELNRPQARQVYRSIFRVLRKNKTHPIQAAVLFRNHRSILRKKEADKYFQEAMKRYYPIVEKNGRKIIEFEEKEQERLFPPYGVKSPFKFQTIPTSTLLRLQAYLKPHYGKLSIRVSGYQRLATVDKAPYNGFYSHLINLLIEQKAIKEIVY